MEKVKEPFPCIPVLTSCGQMCLQNRGLKFFLRNSAKKLFCTVRVSGHLAGKDMPPFFPEDTMLARRELLKGLCVAGALMLGSLCVPAQAQPPRDGRPGPDRKPPAPHNPPKPRKPEAHKPPRPRKPEPHKPPKPHKPEPPRPGRPGPDHRPPR